jgi:hypothetical protein
MKVPVLDFELERRFAMTDWEEDLKKNSVLALTMRLEPLPIRAFGASCGGLCGLASCQIDLSQA